MTEWSKIVPGPFSLRARRIKFVLGIGNWLAKRFLILSTNFEARVDPPKTLLLALGIWFFGRQDVLLASSWVLLRCGPKPLRVCSLHPAPVDPAGSRQLMQHFHSRPTAITLGPRWDPVALRAPDPIEQHNAPHHVTVDPVGSHQQKAPHTHTSGEHSSTQCPKCGSHRILTGSRRRNSPNPSERHKNALHRVTADPVGPRQYHAPNPNEEHSSAQGSVRIPSTP